MATWQRFNVFGAGHSNPGSPIAAVARLPSSMEWWTIDQRGAVQGAFWYEGQSAWRGYELAGPGSAATQGGLAAVSRAPNAMELWWAGSNGSLQGRFWYEGPGGWQSYELAGAGSVMSGSGIAAVSRMPGSMEVWFVGADAAIRDAHWYEGVGWRQFELAPAGSAAPGTRIAALSRAPGALEIWWVGGDGSVQSAFWYEGMPAWTRYELAPAGSAVGALTALSRLPGAMEVWWIGVDGSVQGAFWYEGSQWRRYELAQPGAAASGGSIASLSRMPNTMEVWWIGPDRSVQDAFWYEGGSWGRFALAGPGSAAMASEIGAVSRRADALEIWWHGEDGAVADSFVYVEWPRRERTAASPRDIVDVAAVSRHADALDVAVVGRNGVFAASWGEGEGWAHDVQPVTGEPPQNYWTPIGGDLRRREPLALVSRRPQIIDAFGRTLRASTGTNWFFDGRWAATGSGDWVDLGRAGPVDFHGLVGTEGVEIAAVSRRPDNLDLFTVGDDGKIYTAWWSAGQEWTGRDNRWLCLEGDFSRTASVTAIARQPDVIDLFVVAENGVVHTAWWHGVDWSSVGPGRGWLPIGGDFPADAVVAAVARTSNNLDLFAVGKDGQVRTAEWAGGEWSGAGNDWRPIGGKFRVYSSFVQQPTARVTALARAPGNIDLFAIGAGGEVFTSWWNGGDWSGIAGWRPIGRSFPEGRKVAAVARTPNNLDLFVAGHDGHVWASGWAAGGDWSGLGGWMRLEGEEIYHEMPIESGGLHSLGGKVRFWVRANGTYTIDFHVHNSGMVGYDFVVRASLLLPSGIVVTGSFEGFVDADPRNADKTIDGANDLIRLMWRTGETRMDGWVDLHHDMTGVIGFLGDVVEGIIGRAAQAVGAGAGIIIGLAHEIGGLVPGLGIGAVFGVLAGVVLFAATGGSLLIATVAGLGIGTITNALVRERKLRAREIELLRVIFADQIPYDKVVLTNLSGIGGRPFCMPGVDGLTYISLGKTFSDADLVKDDGVLKSVFVHEMTHAWQIEHSKFVPGLVCSGIVNQVDHTLFDDHIYRPGPPTTKWSDFNLEQQASVVEEWFEGKATIEAPRREPMNAADPYFHYVQDNIRQGHN